METQIKDILCELCNVGIGSGMAALSHIIDREVNYSIPDADGLKAYSMIADPYLKAENYVAGVSLPFDGDIEGMILIIYKPSMVRVILEQTYGSAPGWKDIGGELLDMVRETANIMASTYLTALSTYTKWNLNAGRSAVTMDMAGSMIGEAAGMVAYEDQDVLCIASRFGLETEEKENCMLMMIKEHSIPGFLETLGGERCAGL